MRSFVGLGTLAVLLVLEQAMASAAPILQLQPLEGAAHDVTAHRWVPAPRGTSIGLAAQGWAVGDAAELEGKHLIYQPRLQAAFGAEDLARSIPITPTSISLGDFVGGLVIDGGARMLSCGADLALGRLFARGSLWFGYPLGALTCTLADSPVADLLGSFHRAPDAVAGQIEVYQVSAIVHGTATLTYDLPNAVISQDRPEFSLFCSDADRERNRMPEPGAVLIWLLIGLTWAGSAWVYQYCSRWRQWRLQPVAAVAAGQEVLELREQQILEAELQRESGLKTQGPNDEVG